MPKIMENEFSVTKTTVECYKIRGKRGAWADIVVDSNGNAGRIQIASDYGSWEHYWGSCGVGFKKFLIGLDIHYAAGKFGEGRWFDHEATMEQLRVDILSHTDSKEERLELTEELDTLKDCDEVNTFCHLAFECENLHKIWDGSPDIKTNISPSFRQFWEKLWPVFIAELKKEAEILQEERIFGMD